MKEQRLPSRGARKVEQTKIAVVGRNHPVGQVSKRRFPKTDPSTSMTPIRILTKDASFTSSGFQDDLTQVIHGLSIWHTLRNGRFVIEYRGLVVLITGSLSLLKFICVTSGEESFHHGTEPSIDLGFFSINHGVMGVGISKFLLLSQNFLSWTVTRVLALSYLNQAQSRLGTRP